jgi:transcriptional regulator with XRE-family HTH domain
MAWFFRISSICFSSCLYLTELFDNGGKKKFNRGMENTLGGRIREVRDRQGLTLVGLGEILSLGKSAVSQYEHNLTNPSPDTLVKIADLGNVTLDWLITGKESDTHGHSLTNETAPSYSNNFDEETVATVMALLDQLEDFFGEKLPAQKKAKIFVHIYADKIAGKPIRLTDFGDLLKAQG